jgi:hypothetical protein
MTCQPCAGKGVHITHQPNKVTHTRCKVCRGEGQVGKRASTLRPQSTPLRVYTPENRGRN